MSENRGYSVTEYKRRVSTTSQSVSDVRIHSYDEAINLAGNGWYNISLLATLSMASFAMGCDMFGFSVVVSGATCDFQLDLSQTSLLLSMSFIGPIAMAYPWGYISDTQGRRKSLLISLWVSFLVSCLSAFSPNWIIMAALKFISTSFSSCAQSSTYTLLGESCPQRVRDGYMLIMTSMLDFVLSFYVGVAYGILNLEFNYDLGFITFTPWRLLTLILASTLGVAAFGVHFVYESPKFLLNAGRDGEVLEILNKIYRRNGGQEDFPVKKVFLNEEGNTRVDGPLWLSLWYQIVPLFQPPLLWRSLQIFFLLFTVYGTCNSYLIWFPFLAQKFLEGIASTSASDRNKGLCAMITSNHGNFRENIECTSKMEISLVWSSLAQGSVFVLILFCIAKVVHRKRTLMIIILLLSSVCGVGAVVIVDNITSFLMFFGQLANELVVGMIYSFIVDIYPTSYRGMAACLATMVTRIGTISGVNLLGAYVMTHCTWSFIVCSVLTIGGAVVSFLLPPNKRRQ